jgi:two-component system cell cycle sensor histidine kinase/response regulator CckA
MPHDGVPRGSERIVIADDEPGVCSFMARVLQSLGYTVHTATDGQAALDLLSALAQAELAPCDLLLTDVVMPGMDGTQLAARVILLFPSVAVVYMSGMTDVLPRGAFLQKPFGIHALATCVRGALDGIVARPAL